MTPTDVANAYSAVARTAAQDAQQDKAFTETGGFAGMLQDAVSGVIESGHAAEQTGMQAATGQADVVDVVTAVSESELALETMVTVRDRVIQAYEEIMRMPI